MPNIDRRLARIEKVLGRPIDKFPRVICVFVHTEEEAEEAAKRLANEHPGDSHMVVGFVPADLTGWPTMAANRTAKIGGH